MPNWKKSVYFCRDCGGELVGDGETLARQCEFASSVDCVEPDSGPHYCGFTGAIQEKCEEQEAQK